MCLVEQMKSNDKDIRNGGSELQNQELAIQDRYEKKYLHPKAGESLEFSSEDSWDSFTQYIQSGINISFNFMDIVQEICSKVNKNQPWSYWWSRGLLVQ